MDRAARRGLAEPAEIADVVVTLEEDALPVVATLDHVQRLILDEIPAQALHARSDCMPSLTYYRSRIGAS
jgi:hypothetical protein